MKIKSWILLILTVIIAVLAVIVGFSSKKEEKPSPEIKSEEQPTETPLPPENRENKTGGIVSQTPQQNEANKEIAKLRLAAPIATDQFVISMDWKNGIFRVKPIKPNVGVNDLSKWLTDNGYGAITSDNFAWEK